MEGDITYYRLRGFLKRCERTLSESAHFMITAISLSPFKLNSKKVILIASYGSSF